MNQKVDHFRINNGVYELYIQKENKPGYTGTYLINQTRLRRFSLSPGDELDTDDIRQFEDLESSFEEYLTGYEPVSEHVASVFRENGYTNMVADTVNYKSEIIKVEPIITYNSDW